MAALRDLNHEELPGLIDAAIADDLPEPIGPHLARLREARTPPVTRQHMADRFGVKWPMIQQFEQGKASRRLAMGYIEELQVTPEEKEQISDDIAVALMKLLMRRPANEEERLLLLDALARAARGAYAAAIPAAMEEGRWRPRPDLNRRADTWGACPECGHPELVATAGRHYDPASPDQLSFFPLREHAIGQRNTVS